MIINNILSASYLIYIFHDTVSFIICIMAVAFAEVKIIDKNEKQQGLPANDSVSWMLDLKMVSHGITVTNVKRLNS